MSSLSEIKAFVRRDVVASVSEALGEAGVARLWVGHVHALGVGVDPENFSVSLEEGGTYSHLARLEFLARPEEVDGLIERIRERAGTGHRGDGVVVVTEPVAAVSVRTGDRDRLAIL